MGGTAGVRSRWQRWVLPAAAVLGAGPWGALAGATLFWMVGEAVGVTFAEPGGIFPEFYFWPLMWLLVGFGVGFAATAHGALRLVQRSPRVLGGVLVAGTGLTLAATLSDPSGWDGLYFWLPGLVPAAAVVGFRMRRKRP